MAPSTRDITPVHTPGSRRSWLLIVVLAVSTTVAILGLGRLGDGRLHVYFLDVGQGDAILVRTPDGRQLLVDGGPSPSALLGDIGELLPFWDRSLDLVVLTHPDGDHMDGLLPLLERYRVTQVLAPPVVGTSERWTRWTDALAAAGVPSTAAGRGMRLLAGDLQLAVLNPAGQPAAADSPGENDRSIVLRLQYGNISMLLAGDAGSEVESAMLREGLPLRADVLKVSHHGSNTGTSASFLTTVAPEVAVIQVGEDNLFGHPDPDVLARLQGTLLLRTDLHGRVEIISDGHRIWVRTERSPGPAGD